MKRYLPVAVTGLLAFSTAACSDSVSPEGGDLTPAEVRSLAFGVSGLSVDENEDAIWSESSPAVTSTPPSLALAVADGPSAHSGAASGGGFAGGLGLWEPLGLGRHGNTTITVDRTASCPRGGTTHIATTITTVVDEVARTGSVTYESTNTPEACAFPVRRMNAVFSTVAEPGTVITITGSPNLVTRMESAFSWDAPDALHDGRPRRSASTGSQEGSFTYLTSDGRSGACDVNVTTAFDPEERTHSVTGTFCGQAIDISATLPHRHRRPR